MGYKYGMPFEIVTVSPMDEKDKYQSFVESLNMNNPSRLLRKSN